MKSYCKTPAPPVVLGSQYSCLTERRKTWEMLGNLSQATAAGGGGLRLLCLSRQALSLPLLPTPWRRQQLYLLLGWLGPHTAGWVEGGQVCLGIPWSLSPKPRLPTLQV